MHYIIHDLADLRRDFVALRVRTDSEITTCNIKADAAQGNFVFVGDYAADRLRITFVAIGAKDAAVPSRRDATLDLLDRCFVVLAKNFRLRFHQTT